MKQTAPLALLAGLLGIALPAGAAPVTAAKKPAAKPAAKSTMTAQQVLDRFVQATGGDAAYAKIKTMVMKGDLKVSTGGLTGTFEVNAKEPDRILVVQTISGIGETKEGFDGKKGWARDPINGLRDLSGQELSSMKRASSLNTPSDWKKLYKSVAMAGIRKVGDRSAYAVKMIPAEGKPTVSYYDTKTFYLIKMDMTVESPQGTIPTESFLSDYRNVDGVMLPFVTRQRVAGLTEVTLTTSEIKTNVTLEDSLFDKPAQ